MRVLGACCVTVTGAGTLPLEPFQRRFREMEAAAHMPPPQGGGSPPKDAANTIALRLGWFYQGVPDGPRVRRTLGLRADSPTRDGDKYYPPRRREYVTVEMARRLCDAMDLAPVEVGL